MTKKKIQSKKKTQTKKVVRSKSFTPQQIDFALRFYVPTSETYGNAMQSALASGFSQSYAKNITRFDLKWLEKVLSEIIGKSTDKKNMVEKAKKVLDESLDSKDERIKSDVAKFIAKTTDEFREKTDMTSNGETINGIVVEFVNGKSKRAKKG